jgi:hypothetical protein
MTGVTLRLEQAPDGSDFQKYDGGPHQALALVACEDCREVSTPRARMRGETEITCISS